MARRWLPRAEGVEARPVAAKRATVTLLERSNLVNRAEAEGRLLVSWSTYEREVIRGFCLRWQRFEEQVCGAFPRR